MAASAAAKGAAVTKGTATAVGTAAVKSAAVAKDATSGATGVAVAGLSLTKDAASMGLSLAKDAADKSINVAKDGAKMAKKITRRSLRKPVTDEMVEEATSAERWFTAAGGWQESATWAEQSPAPPALTVKGAAGAAASGAIGELRVEVLEAELADKARSADFLSAPDPYAVVLFESTAARTRARATALDARPPCSPPPPRLTPTPPRASQTRCSM